MHFSGSFYSIYSILGLTQQQPTSESNCMAPLPAWSSSQPSPSQPALPASRAGGGPPPAKRPRQEHYDVRGEDDGDTKDEEYESKTVSPDPADFLHHNHMEEEEGLQEVRHYFGELTLTSIWYPRFCGSERRFGFGF